MNKNNRKQMRRMRMKRDWKWMRNPDQLKNPKIFTMTALRHKDGTFELLGGSTKVLCRKNQHGAYWENVDTRDFARELNNNKVIAK